MSLFCHNKLDLGLCGWGLKFEHRFTGKSAGSETADSSKSVSWNFNDPLFLKAVKAKYNGFEPFGYGPPRARSKVQKVENLRRYLRFGGFR
jgi:hypothetical protein